MVFPVLLGVFVAGALRLNPGEVPVTDELVQLAATKPIGQLPGRLAANHRGIASKDVMQLKQVVEALVGIPNVIARQDLLGYVEGFGHGKPLLVIGHALALLVCAHGEHADVGGIGQSALGHACHVPPPSPLRIAGSRLSRARFGRACHSIDCQEWL